ncbi:uroporphyrinogen-III C-methyltransferase [Asticcacaulis sp. BYS171W]|uniref:uroporphyrinogen-III C-methyltransferase n=1 Tax=Asticcacaulis aquaticus TaxID=2984212 RepID=A0ABT5HRT8_9CAUL|nr:uroporphyrinogen-III C-methyltransferase [Asticcacaulis aquaticus]MDC7682785.1 uroporphyrinogen-III C-methyltransferase [Asticcacaulis aquaticus]
MPNGFVSLVGAGPGDADHLTLGALKALQSAQALLYDALVSEDILALAPDRCVKICVGKRGDRLSVPQDKTNALMVRLANKELHVVRLKGGDPSVFGRVEEERLYLDQHGIAHKTLPGVTAASAAAAQFAFPLTHRGEARTVTFLTGRTLSGSIDLKAATVADPGASLVFYMASHNAADIQAQLLAAGRQPSTPVIVVENAGRAQARAQSASLQHLAAMVGDNGWEGPVLIGVGDAFAYARLDLSMGQSPLISETPISARG